MLNMTIDLTSKPGSAKANKTGGWRTFIPKTDKNVCIGCGTCERVCPEDAIEMKKDKRHKGLRPKTDMNFCKGCGLCAEECPVKAIKMEREEK
ncbi:4Fe-4S dicluster domain-containing protein [Candidatus Falkowbacteria bacterium]|nr:4Fe-4S dicluster domain-containing protein [Candidatus Falkowbacteria bacterium]